MGFKTDTSFLRYLTMGALASRHVAEQLRHFGFRLIELERYSTSNKIWATKIKRLRLPDLMCVNTGLRIEVRAKSSLEIRMSHAPNNPDRHWDSGLSDPDVIALVPCADYRGALAVAGNPTYFTVETLRESADPQQISRLKSAAEGSEQHLTWPAVVSTRPGHVTAVDPDHISVQWEGDGKPARRHTFALKGRRPYVVAGQSFLAYSQILAGMPAQLADLTVYQNHRYYPLDDLLNPDPVARYAAAKAIPFREDTHRAARPILSTQIGSDEDLRIALEIAHTAAALGISAGHDFILRVIEDLGLEPMRMEGVFVLTELGRNGQAAFATDALNAIAGNVQYSGSEVRQAAVWGLGRAGVQAYDRLLAYLTDPEEDVALHAVAAFGPSASDTVINHLISGMLTGNIALAAACSVALQVIGTEAVIRALKQASNTAHPCRSWVIATLGRMPEPMVRAVLTGDPILTELQPLLLYSTSANWLAQEDTNASLRFLLKQVL